MKNKYFIGCCFIMCSTQALSQAKQNKIAKWFTDHNISIRKSFTGSSKDEGKPAVFFWNKDFQNKTSYTTIDVGLKVAQIPFFNNSKHFIVTGFPKFEWHKDGAKGSTGAKNSISAGANMEVLYFKDPASLTNIQGPALTASYNYKNDYIKKVNTNEVNAYLSYFGEKAGMPGHSIRNKTDVYRFRYYPYIGFESYSKATEGSQNSQFWVARFFAEYFPISTKEKQFLQFTFDYSYRGVIHDKLYKMGTMNVVSAGINIYPNGTPNFGFGIDYQKGYDPANSFVKTDKFDVGIKVKL